MVAAAGLLLATTTIGCGDSSGRAVSGGDWMSVTTSPLGPRHSAALLWAGTELLVVGGDTSPPCPPGASCVYEPEGLRDGAAFDPGTGRWRRLAVAPAPISANLAAPVVVAGSAHYVTASGLARYDVAEDRWSTLPPPPAFGERSYRLVAGDGRLIAYASTEEHDGDASDLGDYVLNAAGTGWDALPADPLAPAFDRTMVAVGSKVVLFSNDLLRLRAGGEVPSPQVSVLDLATGAWEPARAAPIGWGAADWAEVEGRVVSMDLGRTGTGRPVGGVFDPESGEWLPRSEAPPGITAQLGLVWQREILDQRPGWFLRGRTWLRIPPVPAPRFTQDQALAWTNRYVFVFGGGFPTWRMDEEPVLSNVLYVFAVPA